ncbi:MAG TPA: acyltransferase [Candidatus Sulfotelmatobacter sp.]|nr:acyltransferase [Candidatus Sulfotelmatobacter sp.]
MPLESPSALKNPRYPILDALRFILAFWVVMDHFGVFPLFAGAEATSVMGHTLPRIWGSFVYGVPAVMGFFVISGFCIHLPFRHGENLLVGPYYARRYIRILVPVFAAIAIHRLAGSRAPLLGQNTVLWVGVLWSLLCEEIYYAVYPVLRFLRMRLGWPLLLSSTMALAVITSSIRRYPSWTGYGPLRTALILLPVWLLGCHLAEISDQLPSIQSPYTIWGWRFLAWAGSWVCETLNFQAGIPYTQTMLWFGILAYFWLRKEIAYGANHKPLALFASAGAWSYSLYLMHIPAWDILQKFHVPNLGYISDWCLTAGFLLGVSYLFYLVIERPSHKLARRFQPTGIRQPAPKTLSATAPDSGFAAPVSLPSGEGET